MHCPIALQGHLYPQKTLIQSNHHPELVPGLTYSELVGVALQSCGTQLLTHPSYLPSPTLHSPSIVYTVCTSIFHQWWTTLFGILPPPPPPPPPPPHPNPLYQTMTSVLVWDTGQAEVLHYTTIMEVHNGVRLKCSITNGGPMGASNCQSGQLCIVPPSLQGPMGDAGPHWICKEQLDGTTGVTIKVLVW